MAVPVGLALLFLMGVGPALPWGRATPEQVRQALVPPLAGGALLGIVALATGVRNPWTLLALVFGGYAAHVTLRELWLPLRQRRASGLWRAFVEAQLTRGRRRFGAYVVHAAVVVIIVAIAVSSTQRVGSEMQLARGESATVGAYRLTFLGADERVEPHRQSLVARVAVEKDGRALGVMQPRMNHYFTQREPIGTPAVRTTLREDLYLSIMNVDPARQTLALQALVNPMVGWIWVATGVLALGALISLVPPRRRAAEAVGAPAAAPAYGAARSAR
jgi:cytochrome c-type biogenesis protein CcmF